MEKEIMAGNILIAPFMGNHPKKNIADMSHKDDMCISDLINELLAQCVKDKKGSGTEWLLVRHRDKNIQIFTDGTYCKVKDEDVKTMYGEFFLEDLDYYSDWNLLMEVVKKCSGIDNNRISADLSLSIFTHNHIEIVWAAVVKFIEWYNDNQK